jgi:hypothetical protein
MNTGVAVALIGTLITAVGSIVVALIARAQQRQQGEIDMLSFLVSHFLPRWELDHLQKLARGEPLPYDKGRYPGFEQEVRQLRDRDLITPKNPSFHVGDLPVRGDLQEYFKLSPDGERYLELWRQINAKK